MEQEMASHLCRWEVPGHADIATAGSSLTHCDPDDEQDLRLGQRHQHPIRVKQQPHLNRPRQGNSKERCKETEMHPFRRAPP